MFFRIIFSVWPQVAQARNMIERVPVRAAILSCFGFICNLGVGVGVFLHSKTFFFWVACKLRYFSASYDNTFCLEGLYLKKDLLAALPYG